VEHIALEPFNWQSRPLLKCARSMVYMLRVIRASKFNVFLLRQIIVHPYQILERELLSRFHHPVFVGKWLKNVGVTLAMNSYSDPNFSEQNSAFVIQNAGFIYFLVAVESSPQVSVVSLYVDQVTINSATLANGQLVLFDSINSNPPVTSSGTTFQYGGSSFNLPSNGVYAGFSIGEVSAWNVPQDGQSPATVAAQVTVSYQGGAKKRSLMNIQTSTSGSTQTNSETPITLTNSTAPSLPFDKSQSSFVYSSCALVVLFLLLLQLL